MDRRWLALLMMACMMFGTGSRARQKDPDQAGSWTGTLRLDVVAVGGETTGTVLETGAGNFELLPANPDVKAELKKLGDQTVTVRGTLATRPGVEVKERRIITVTRITRAGSTPTP